MLRIPMVMLIPAALAAQDLPPYIPVNPILASRSALYAQPYIPRHNGWTLRTVVDYSNAVEVADAPGQRDYTFDAEVLEADLWVTRDVSRRLFIVGDLPVRGGYNGFLDQFLNWYHGVIGIPVPARNELPLNTFQWVFDLPDGRVITRQRPGTFLGDVRGGVGLRFGRAQLLATATLPTTSTPDDGWGRKVVGTSLALTDNLVRSSRFVVDAELSAGWTPTTGDLAIYQRSVFTGEMVSARWRFTGNQALFATIWTQSDNWKGTGFTTMDSPEVTMDFGGLLHIKRNWPELQLGLTEDLAPAGPAVDIGFKLGLRW